MLAYATKLEYSVHKLSSRELYPAIAHFLALIVFAARAWRAAPTLPSSFKISKNIINLL
jgi:hypothetical protein